MGGDPGTEEGFVFGVVLLNGLYDGAVVEVGESGSNVDGEEGVVGALVEEGLGELVEFLRAGGASDGVLVWCYCFGYFRGDVLGYGSGYDATGDGAARDGADVAVGFKEWYNAC